MKRKDKNKKKELLLTIIALIGLVVITVGISYAFFNYAKEGSTENTITTGSITFLYTEIDKIGNGISLSDAFPMSDEIGMKQEGKGKVFNFKITSTSTSTNNIPYEITARKDPNSSLDESAVKMYLTKVNANTEQLVKLANYSELPQTDKVETGKYTEKVLHSDRVPSHQEKYEQEYKLRMWIDENTDFSQNDDETYPYNDQTFTVTINVYANAKVITEEDKQLESNADISTVNVNGIELEPVENQEYQYETSLEEGTTETEIQVETENPYASVKIEKIDSLAYQSSSNIKRLSTSKKVQLNPGDNYFKVTVTSEDEEKTNEYKIKIKVAIGQVLLRNEIFRVYTDIQENPTLITTSEKANEKGLYKSDATNSGQSTYYFRGNVINNYVSFAGQIWRIIRINEDGSIRMIMQNGINSNARYHFNEMNDMYYSNSSVTTTNGKGAKKAIDDWYEANITAKGLDNKVLKAEYCEQAKVCASADSSVSSCSGMQSYKNYTPNFNCGTDRILQLKVGLITYDEVVFAGGYKDISNESFYLYNNSDGFWTMSPSFSSKSLWNFVNGSRKNAYVSSGHADNYSLSFRPVINLLSDTKVLGLGTVGQPWVVQ